MNHIGKPERVTQNRIVALFVNQLGYKYLGDWSERQGNSNIEEAELTAYLTRAGYGPASIRKAIHRLRNEADDAYRGLYRNNQAVYEKLRYGDGVKEEVGKITDPVHFIDWKHPEKNKFGIAEEVTLRGVRERRPDLVLYVNGIALGVVELKSSVSGLGNGIRQNLSNQSEEFNAWFFSTVQMVFAGNDSEGLKFGTIETQDKFFLSWKEDEADNTGYKVDKYLAKMCAKERFLELIYDFVLFDGGVKKLPRVHQYFGVKAAQAHVVGRQGGIIWHTQGSGKSLVMVLLAKWILENNPNARVAIITDRDELDKQIKGVFAAAGEAIYRTRSSRDLLKQLAASTPRLLCSLVHKFGVSAGQDFEAFIKELEANPSRTVGDVYVFVDECHRTQSGRLNRAMKAYLPNAVFIGFTGTPLLKEDKATSQEVFGGYIHTYKYSEAVEDKVVLEIRYEARDIDQRLGATDKIDEWFEAKTRGLNNWRKEELKRHWGTLQNVLSSKSRMERVVKDIIHDFAVKPRISQSRGNAILVASSIFEATKYYTLFQATNFRGKCAVVTSYNPQAKDVTLEETGANTETDKQFIFHAYTELLDRVQAKPGQTKTETYEDWAKDQFKDQPAQMKLLVVVDKLLTGFDAPTCTYLYIDKSMRDHALFQAICRTNRLDSEDKEFGYIVDYKDLFKNLVNDKGTGAMQVYTSELDTTAPGCDPTVLMQDRLKKGKEQLENGLEALALLCEQVEPPKGELQYIHNFCGNTEVASDLMEHEPQRMALYRGVVALVRAYANLADEMDLAGYDAAGTAEIKRLLKHYLDLRDTIRNASQEFLDLKPFEADMRHLIDTYIDADAPRLISPFDDMGLLELMESAGIENAIRTRLGGLRDRDAVAETIENNVRRTILKEHLNDPAYYERMSALLDEIIVSRRAKAIEYEEFLRRIAALARQVTTGQAADIPEPLKRSRGLRALYNNLLKVGALTDSVSEKSTDQTALDLAQRIDAAVKQSRPDAWRGHEPKERIIKGAMYTVLQDEQEVERLFQIIRQHLEEY
ncbi:MAG: HsdR family type I site-specific deoxyribonuclease [Fibrobacterota bacterium]|nr:HsdR family type I site-specific deoxyribonuclease [Fibrobacterota bacterium]